MLTYAAPSFILNGNAVAAPIVSGAANSAVSLAQFRMSKLAGDLQGGFISLADWYAAMQTEVVNLHAAQIALARGGWANMTADDWAKAADTAAGKLDKLRAFGDDIAAGRYGADVESKAFNARASLYAVDGRTTFENETLAVAKDETGATEAMRVLGGGVNSCQECLDLAGTWMPIDEMLDDHPIGSCSCGSRCWCVVVTRG